MRTILIRSTKVFSLLFFFFAATVSAQENTQAPTLPPPLTAEQLANPPAETEGITTVLVATVNIYDAVIQKQDGRTITASFILSNREGVQPDITYAAHLIAPSNDQFTTLDAGVFPAKEKVTLRENDNQAKTLTFTVPDSVTAGEYSVEIWASNPSGINLARQAVGKVTLPKSNGGIIMRGNQCTLHIADENPSKNYSPFTGIDIASNETMLLECSVTNTMDRSVQVAPAFATYRRNIASGVRVDTPSVSNDPFTLSSRETKKITLRLPRAALPQAYDVSVVLGDQTGAQISDTLIVHYVVRGASGTIQNLLLDKDVYMTGETANATVTFSKSADRFPGARAGDGTGTQIDAVKIELSLVDVNGQVCAEPVTRSISKDDPVQQKFSFPVTKNCKQPTVTVRLIKADDGTVLDTVSASLASSVPTTDVKPATQSFVPQDEPLFSRESLMVGVIVVILLVLLGTLGIKVARSRGRMLGLLFFFVLSVSFMFGAGEARADTIYTTSSYVITGYTYDYVWNPLLDTGSYDYWTGLPILGGYELVMSPIYSLAFGSGDVFGTYSLDKSAYTVGESMTGTVSFQYPSCTNGWYAAGYFYIRPHQDAGYALGPDTTDSRFAEETASPLARYTWLDSFASLWRVPKAEAGSIFYPTTAGSKSFTVGNWNAASPYATFWFRVVQITGSNTNFYRNIPYTLSKTPTVTFTASPNPVSYNTPATLNWSSTDATSCTAGGAWSGVKAASGSYSTGNLTASQTYTLYCTGPAGNSAIQTITVSIKAPTVSFTINGSSGPLTIAQGAMRNFAWTATDATSCTAASSDGWAGGKAVPTGTESLVANSTSNHILTCNGPGGSGSKNIMVTVTCTPTLGVYGACDCSTETKSRSNLLPTCLYGTETIDCNTSEKNSCRDFNWKEVAP